MPTADAATQTPTTAPTTGEVVSSPHPSAGSPATAAPGRQQEAPSEGTLPAASSQPVAATTSVAPPTVAGAVAGPIGPAASSVPTASTATSTAGAVTSQVFPEITRLVTTGNGTHRIRLQLEPEALGDVRVVLTIRNGAVDVRLSAGEDAQRALREGAPELRRLLELVGASDTKISVRDLSSGSAPGNGNGTNLTGQWGGDGFGRGTSGDVWSGGDRSQHQHAGTRGGSSAKEGINDGAVPHRPVHPATRTRTSGVDVTM